MRNDNAALMRVIDAMPPKRRAEYFREIADYYRRRSDKEQSAADLLHAESIEREADLIDPPHDPHQAAEAAAFSLMPTLDRPKTTTTQNTLF